MSGTRLVGAVRLCVEVPAEWPFLGWGRVTCSHVRVRRSWVVPAIGFPPPPQDAAVLELTAENPGRPQRDRPVVLPPWTPDVLAGHPAAVLREDISHDRSWHRWSVDSLDAYLDLSGPPDVCRTIEDSARVIEAGAAAVPNPWLDVRGGDLGEVSHDTGYLRDLYDRWGSSLPSTGRRSGLTRGPTSSDATRTRQR